jgi:hypothetical protein
VSSRCSGAAGRRAKVGMLPPLLVVGAGDSTRSPERRLASDAHADINLLSGTRRAPPAGGVPPVSRHLKVARSSWEPAHPRGAGDSVVRSAWFQAAFGIPPCVCQRARLASYGRVDHQPLRRSRRSCRHHRPERASNEVPGCGTQVRPIPLATSTRNLARFALRASVSGAVPLTAQHGFANSGRGPEGRRCPVAADTIDASFRRFTVRHTKGPRARRTLTPEGQLSTVENLQTSSRRPWPAETVHAEVASQTPIASYAAVSEEVRRPG